MHQFASYAKSSLDETKNHVNDGREDEYFSEDDTRRVLRLIARAIGAISGWMRYLESPDARRFYAAHREKLLADGGPERRSKRKKGVAPNDRKQNPEPRTENHEPRTTNHEPRTTNLEPPNP